MRHSLLLLALFAACSNPPAAPPTPSAIQVVSGASQTGVPGYRLAAPITVRLIDDGGHAVIGDTIEFTPDDAMGSVEGATTFVTDSSGSVSGNWRLGGTLGTQSLAITAKSLPQVGRTILTATSRSNYMTSVVGGRDGMCGIDAQGQLGCWVPPTIRTPDASNTQLALVAPSMRFEQIASSSLGTEACATATTGRVWCFHETSRGVPGSLVELAGSYPALVKIVTGGVDDHIYCGLTGVGEAWCWGDNGLGGLGDGTTTSHAAPAPVSTVARFAQLDVNGETVCAVTFTGLVWCWGRNSQFETGSATGGPAVTIPTLVSASVSFDRIRTLGATCGFAGSSMYCWGAVGEIVAPATTPPSATVIPVSISGSPIDMVETRWMRIGLTRVGALIWGGTTGGDLSSREGFASFPRPALVPILLQNMTLVHGDDFVCGAAILGGATLCPSSDAMWSPLAGYFGHSDFSLPPVVGVPFP